MKKLKNDTQDIQSRTKYVESAVKSLSRITKDLQNSTENLNLGEFLSKYTVLLLLILQSFFLLSYVLDFQHFV